MKTRNRTISQHPLHHWTTNDTRVRQICIIKTGAFGDVCQTLPIVPALKRRYPQAEISWVINNNLQDLVSGHPDMRSHIVLKSKDGWDGWMRLFEQMQARRFDIVLDFVGLLRTVSMVTNGGRQWKFGLHSAREGANWPCTHIIPRTEWAVAAHSRYFNAVKALGCREDHFEAKYHVPDQVVAEANGFLGDVPRPFLVVHPCASVETKRWPAEKFAGLLGRAIRNHGLGVVLIGNRHAQAPAEIVMERLRRGGLEAYAKNLAGQTTIKQTIAVCRQGKLLISNDSGPLHLGASLGLPTLGIFTCTDPDRSGPAGPKHEMIQAPIGCAGSYLHCCPFEGDQQFACFRALTIDAVWDRLVRLLSK